MTGMIDSPSVFKLRGEPGALGLVNHALPPLGDHEVLVRVAHAAICGTDIHLYKWNAWAARSYRPPFPLGHEFSGEVLATGSHVRAVQAGDRVTAETHISCGHCAQCRANRRHTCLNLGLFSKLGRGCFSSHTVLPEAVLRRVPEEVPLHIAALMEPIGVAVRAVMEADVRAKSVLVVGCGPIGLLAIAAAKSTGATCIIGTDLSAARRELAGVAGATAIVDAGEPLTDAVYRATGGLGVDAAIDTSGHDQAIRSALAAVAPGGRLVIASLPAQDVLLDLTRHVVLREVSLLGVYGRLIDETWLSVENLLRSRAIDPEPLITHRFKLADFQQAFECAASGAGGKVLLDCG